MCVFFFKQKTAYEMRISDWSSDVCSSDLGIQALNGLGSLGIGELFADLDRQIAEYSAGIDPLYAVDLDIAHYKRRKRICNAGNKQGCQKNRHRALGKRVFPAKRHPGISLDD